MEFRAMERAMASRLSNLVAAALLATTSFVPLANVASAMPLDTLVIRKATNVEAVHWRGRGWGIGAAIVGGAILGGMLAAPYYGPGPYLLTVPVLLTVTAMAMAMAIAPTVPVPITARVMLLHPVTHQAAL
jgi:hypothetical protein